MFDDFSMNFSLNTVGETLDLAPMYKIRQSLPENRPGRVSTRVGLLREATAHTRISL